MKRKLPSGISAETTPPNPKAELGFVPDSPEQVLHSIERIGFRDKLDKAFKVAITRAKKALK